VFETILSLAEEHKIQLIVTTNSQYIYHTVELENVLLLSKQSSDAKRLLSRDDELIGEAIELGLLDIRPRGM